MILAAGRVDVRAVVAAAVAMSSGETADHENPLTCHPNGWGAIWRDPRAEHGLAVHRDVRPLASSVHESPLGGVETDFIAIHARHATLPRNHGLPFTHPLERREGPDWAWYFMHNGFLPTVHQLLGRPESAFDSGEYFDYVVPAGTRSLNVDGTLERVARIPAGGNSGNAIVVCPDRSYVIHWSPAPVAYPRYFTMHQLVRPDLRVVSSEVVPAMAARHEWTPLEADQVLEIPFSPPAAPNQAVQGEDHDQRRNVEPCGV
jgi:hypothetical protein